VRRLGQELLAQASEVVSRTVARNKDSGLALSDIVEQRFERVGEVSTIAVAKWMAGEDPKAAIEVGLAYAPGASTLGAAPPAVPAARGHYFVRNTHLDYRSRSLRPPCDGTRDTHDGDRRS